MVEGTLLVGTGDDAEDVEKALGQTVDVTVRTVGDLDELFDALCYDTVSALLLPRQFDGSSAHDVVRGVRGLYPELPIVAALSATDEDADGIDARTLDVASLTDERVLDAVADALAGRVDSAASRPPSPMETLTMSMFDGFTDHLYAKDGAGRHVLTEGETFGLGELIGQTDSVLDGVEEHPEKSLNDDQYVIENDAPLIDREEYTSGDGGYTLTSKVPWYGPDGSVDGLVGITRDISGRKSQERALRRQHERLAKIAVVAAHELRNELQVASGRLPHVDGDPQQREVVSESLDQLESIVDEVVKLATAERRSADEETVWLSTAAREVWETLSTSDAEFEVRDDRLVEADPETLRLFFEILLSNAVEHGGQAVTVTLDACDAGFSVADDGVGIDLDPPERVFDAGFATTDDGVGVGLFVARRIADDHGWTLGVENRPEGGARFDVTDVEDPT